MADSTQDQERQIQEHEEKLRPKLKDLSYAELRELNKEGWVESKTHGMVGDPTGLALDELMERIDAGGGL